MTDVVNRLHDSIERLTAERDEARADNVKLVAEVARLMAALLDKDKLYVREMAKTALNDVLRTMAQRERAAEAAIALAESELNAIRKLRGFCQISIEAAQKKIEELSP